MANPVVNPATSMIPEIDQEKCTGCKICVKVCPGKCIYLDSQDKAVIDIDYCENCGICAWERPYLCPEEAIKLPWDKWQRF